jgi:adenylate cyclase
MVKIINSLEVKLTVSFILLILVVAGMTFQYTYGETKKQIRLLEKHELETVASLIAKQIDGDDFESLVPGDESTEKFQKIQKMLVDMRTQTDEIYIYTMRKTEKGVEFVVDADYGKIDAAKIGDIYTDTTDELMQGFIKTSSDKAPASDKWGTFLSGYSPIFNSKGESVGLVGVDEELDEVIEKEHFIGNTIYFVSGSGILVAVVLITLFSITIIKDIRKLIVAANRISTGDMDIQLDIKRNDEIGELSESFGRMIASLKIMKDLNKKKR